MDSIVIGSIENREDPDFERPACLQRDLFKRRYYEAQLNKGYCQIYL